MRPAYKKEVEKNEMQLFRVVLFQLLMRLLLPKTRDKVQKRLLTASKYRKNKALALLLCYACKSHITYTLLILKI